MRKVGWVLIGSVVIGLGLAAWQAGQPERSRLACKERMKRIGAALLRHNEDKGRLPVASSDSETPVSWRVAMLPWLGKTSLYESYNQRQAWDGSQNSTLLQHRPDDYWCPEVAEEFKSSYMAVLGVGTAWPYSQPTRLADFADGVSNTGLIVDLHSSTTEWTRPQDVEQMDVVKAIRAGQRHAFSQSVEGTHMLFADGHVRMLSTETDESILRSLLTPNDGEPMTDDAELLERAIRSGQSFSEPSDASALAGTRLSPVADSVLDPGTTVVYCPTLVLGWKQCLQELPELPLTRLGRQLRDSSFSSSDISPESVQIDVQYSMPDHLSVSCQLQKALAFRRVFDAFSIPLTFVDADGPHSVRSFGVTSHWEEWRSALAQVRVHDYRSPDNFVISIANVGGEDLILAKIPQPKTLEAGIREVSDRVQSRLPGIIAKEDFVLPVLELSVFNDFADELNLPGTAPVKTAKQEVRFRLDERGAVILSDVALEVLANGAHSYAPGTRKFIFDKPFMVMLRESPAKRPYLAVWAGNDDLMVPRKGP